MENKDRLDKLVKNVQKVLDGAEHAENIFSPSGTIRRTDNIHSGKFRLVACNENCHENDDENGYVVRSKFHWEEIPMCGCEPNVYACSEAHAKEMSE